MIWATWRMNRAILMALSLGIAAFAIWLVISGTEEADAWAIFTSHHCSLDDVGNSTVCITSLSSSGNFSSINALLCGVLPAILGFLLGVPLVASEIQQRTNRLAWTQSITKSRWLFTKIGVCGVICAAIVGAMAPLIWWWMDTARRTNHIQPSNFDISGIVAVAYVLFAFMLGVALGALIRRPGWAFAACIPTFVLVRGVVRLYVRPYLVPSLAMPTSGSVNNAKLVFRQLFSVPTSQSLLGAPGDREFHLSRLGSGASGRHALGRQAMAHLTANRGLGTWLRAQST
jgi:hypothetical protein